MPLLPEIALQGKFPQVEPFDPTKAMLTAAQLGETQSGTLLNQLKLADAAQTMQRERALADLFQRRLGGGQPPAPGVSAPSAPAVAPPGNPLNPQAAAGPITQTALPGVSSAVPSGAEATPAAPPAPRPLPSAPQPSQRRFADPAFHAEIMGIDPKHGKDYIKFFQDMDKQQTTSETEQLKLMQSKVDLVIQGAGFVREADDPQAAYTGLLTSLRALGFPLTNVPEQYTPQTLQRLVQTTLPIKDQIDTKLAQQRAEAPLKIAEKELEYERITPLAVDRAKRELEATLPGKKEIAAATGSSQLVQTPQGYVRVNPRSGVVEPVQTPSGMLQPKATEAEARAGSFAARAQQAHEIVTPLINKGVKPTSRTQVTEALPFNLGNYLLPEEFQQYRQGVRQFAQALLRKESGAVINEDEYRMTDQTYFPQPGEGPAVIAQKEAARKAVIGQLQQEGQRSSQPVKAATSPHAGIPVDQLTPQQRAEEETWLKRQLGQ